MGNNYNVPIQGSYSENTRTKLTPDIKLTSNELLQIINSQTSAKAIADKEAKDKATRLSKSESAYQKRIKTGIQSSQELADETGAIGDKISLKNLPIVGKHIPEILDVTGMIGNMASGLGRIPLNVEKGDYGQAALSIATPLTVGALAGIGNPNTGQFANNLINPFAGTGDLINKLGNKYLPNAHKLNPYVFRTSPEKFYRQVDNVTYKKDWLKGYKQIDAPKQQFKSEINWGKWNKEIPDNPQLMKEYNAIDYRKNPLSDKEKEMYQWFDEQMRFDKLPETTNKQSIEVLDNFKQRIKTPEGQKRLKELGITEEQLLQDLKIVEDPNTYGYYRGLNKNTIAINPNHPLPKKVVRHEIEHGVQNALRKSKINKAIDGTPAEKLKALETTEIDDILSELTLRREGTPNKVWSKINTNETVNINDYKSLINNKQNATDYFLTGSDGAEKSAFLGEVQQYMMDAGKIPKNSYVQITPEMVKETMVDAMFDEKTGGKYLRLFNIIKADPKNYEIISKGLNKMLSITPLIGAGAYMQNKEYKNGGAIGNNGMFDMNNPNIYKTIVGGLASGALGKEAMEKKELGGYVRTSKSGRKFTYPSFEGQKQEIINRILTK